MVYLSQKPYNLDDSYDQGGRLTYGNEEHLYHVILELWTIGEMDPKKLKFLPKIHVKMAQLDENINHHFQYYWHEPKETLILDELVDVMIKTNKSQDGHSLLMNS